MRQDEDIAEQADEERYARELAGRQHEVDQAIALGRGDADAGTPYSVNRPGQRTMDVIPGICT
jgi:hypothetical protein